MVKRAKVKRLYLREFLTPAYIKNLQADADLQITDGAMPGLQLRYSAKTGKKVFYLWYRVRGSVKQRCIKLGDAGLFSLNDIRTAVVDLKREIMTGSDPHIERRERVRAADAREAKRKRVRELIPVFLEKHCHENNKGSTYTTNAGYCKNHIIPLLGDIYIEDLDLAALQDAYNKIKNNNGASMGDHVLRVISSFLTWAERFEYRPVGSNPCKHVQKVRMPKFKPTLLDKAGYDKLFAALDDALGTERFSAQSVLAIKALALTGCRCGEITDLEHNELDLEHGHLRLNKRKTDFFDVPLSDAAIDIIRDALRHCRSKQYVFHSPKDPTRPIQDLRKVFWWALDRAKLPRMRIHDLRHSFATMATTIGEDIRTLKDVLGHTTINTTEIYAHVSNSAARRVANNTAMAIIAAPPSHGYGATGA